MPPHLKSSHTLQGESHFCSLQPLPLEDTAQHLGAELLSSELSDLSVGGGPKVQRSLPVR